MRAFITHTGLLVLEPESRTEGYALAKWKQASLVSDLLDKPFYKAADILVLPYPPIPEPVGGYRFS